MSAWPEHLAGEPTLWELIQELLDAQLDTAELAAALPFDPAWQRHLDYLRALHRHGTGVLAGGPEVARRW